MNTSSTFYECKFDEIILIYIGNLGEVLVRCNNVLFIRGAEEEDEEGETKD